MRIAIIGIGRLGSVFARALANDHELLLVDRSFDSAREVASETGAQPIQDLADANADLTIIAVKPQHVEEVAKQLKGAPLIVSCAAGISIDKFESWGVRKVIRIMPNICAEVGEAVIAYSLHPETENKEKAFLSAFSSLGLCIKTAESHMDLITALSGSGPAFLAYLAQAMIEEAVANGMDKLTAEQCVAQTMLGTGKLLLGGKTPKDIIKAVATPGGTTDAGIKTLDSASISLHKAIRQAAARSKELGR